TFTQHHHVANRTFVAHRLFIAASPGPHVVLHLAVHGVGVASSTHSRTPAHDLRSPHAQASSPHARPHPWQPPRHHLRAQVRQRLLAPGPQHLRQLPLPRHRRRRDLAPRRARRGRRSGRRGGRRRERGRRPGGAGRPRRPPPGRRDPHL